VLANGFSRYDAARTAAQDACASGGRGLLAWALPELIEASTRSGKHETSNAALRRLEELRPSGSPERALGIRALSRALACADEGADALYQEALERLAAGSLPLHRARARLLYGEWLRRQNRRVHAREQLRAAEGTFSQVGAAGFGERARRELLATGETVRRRTAEARDDLTPQEAHIAALAGRGDTNSEIAAELFLSPRTVEWHLHKVFLKLGISSRRELRAGTRADHLGSARRAEALGADPPGV
jgi:DNA-binding CsgD family transcriptional regulator